METHEGHRQRLYKKFASGEELAQHEVLEILLYNAFPRKNTNPVAHNLLNVFGSLRNIFDADIARLKEVDGIGESAALYLKCVGKCAEAAYKSPFYEIQLKNYGDFKKFAATRLRNRKEEVLEVYFLEQNGRLMYIYSHTDYNEHGVKLEDSGLAAAVAEEKPYGVVFAHNHLTGNSKPSQKDEKFTREMQIFCSINHIRLLDHCIYAADNDIFSYFCDGNIDEIQDKFHVSVILKKQ